MSGLPVDLPRPAPGPTRRPGPSVIYREHAPAPRLTRFVETYWSIRHGGGRSEVVDRVLPDGCMDVIFSLAGPSSLPAGTSVAVGTMTEPLAVGRTDSTHLWGVRFRPGTGAILIGVAAHELTDLVAPLGDFWRGRAHETLERLAEGKDDRARTELLDDLVERRLAADGSCIDGRMLVASEAIARSGGTVPIDDLARTVGLGRRQLERGFLNAVGIPPKVACRVARLRHGLDLLHDGDLSLTRIALRAGYADQAHFTRDFRALTGTTPGTYRARCGP